MVRTAIRRILEVVRALVLLPQRLYANRAFVKGVWLLVVSPTAETRSKTLASIAAFVRHRQVRSSTSENLQEAKGFASTLLAECPGLAEHLENTAHLGALQVLTDYPLSRAAYVGLQLQMLLRIKKTHKGQGLSSPGSEVAYGGKQLTGLEIVQAWALLLSWGHLFGTFATERALLYHLKVRPEERDAFVEGLHPDLREEVRRVIEEESLYRFVHALTAFRISHAPMPAKLRDTLVQLLLHYIRKTDNVRLARLKRLFNTARQLSYLSMHQTLDLPRLEVGAELSEIPAHLVTDDGVSFDPFGPVLPPISLLLDALDRYQFDVFFTGEDSNRVVLRHLRAFHMWWEAATASGRPVTERIEALWSRPHDWPTDEREIGLATAVRLNLPLPRKQWIDEARLWHASATRPWAGASFILTYPPASTLASCTILSNGPLAPGTVHHIGSRLSSHCEASWQGSPMDSNHIRLWRSTAAFGRLLLRYVVKDELEVIVRPVRQIGGSVGYAAVSADRPGLAGRMRKVADAWKDGATSRSAELAALADYIEGLPRDEHPVLAFFGHVLFVDRKTHEERHELDGVVAILSPSNVRWHFLEMKGGRVGTPGAQLQRLRKAMRIGLTATAECHIGCQDVGIRTCEWPA